MSIPELRAAENGFYYAFWSEGRRSRRKSLGTKSEADAKARFAQWILLDGQAAGEELDFTVAELWGVYVAKHAIAAPKAREAAWKNLRPHFGAMSLIAIDQETVDDYERLRALGRIGQPSKPATVRRELAALRACLNWCAEPKRKLLSAKQVPDFDLPPEGEPRDRWLRTWEIQKLLVAAGEMRKGNTRGSSSISGQPESDEAGAGSENRPLHTHEPARPPERGDGLGTASRKRDGLSALRHLAIPGGPSDRSNNSLPPLRDRLSRGERFLWLALETGARKTALLELTWDRVDFETNVIHLNVPGRLVTKKRRADVPISASLRPLLLRAYGERTCDLVLDHKSGIWKTVQKIAARAGVAGVSPNVLRHTAATHMARRGVPLWKIAKILGNSLVIVEKVYAKHCPDDLREAVDMISGGVLEAAE